jgi:hypothetical protein
MANPKREDLIALARTEAQRAGLSPETVPVFLGLIQQESGWNPRAVSSAGAKGLGQLMPGTARELGVTDSFDPVQNIRGAARYFKQQLDRFGDTGLALAAYNWGPGRVNKLVDNPRSVRIPKETLDYVPLVLSKAAQFGSTLAPTNATLAFFPGTGKVVKQTVDRGVDMRVGSADTRAGTMDADAVSSQIKVGKTPGGRPLDPPLPNAPIPTAPQPGMSDMNIAQAPDIGRVANPAPALKNVRTLDEYLKANFGPLAAVADAFPKNYDDQLMNLIERA